LVFFVLQTNFPEYDITKKGKDEQTVKGCYF